MDSYTGALSTETLATRLGACELCLHAAARYTCPACEVRTCSTRCVAQHKKKYDCDGVRSRTSYIPLNKFSDLDLLNDYRLLEEIGRSTRDFAGDKTKKFSRLHNGFPVHLIRLRKAAQYRGIRYQILPEHFVKQKNNTTYLDWASKKISWKVQITFLHAEMLTFHEDRCSELVILKDLVQRYLDAKQYNRALKAYIVAGLDQIEVLMKAEKLTESTKKFYKLDLSKSLKENFCGKTIVGYPQFFIALKNQYTYKAVTETKDSEATSSSSNKDYLHLQSKKTEDSDSISEEEETEKKLLPSYLDLVRKDST